MKNLRFIQVSQANKRFSRRNLLLSGGVLLIALLCYSAPNEELPVPDTNGVMHIQRTALVSSQKLAQSQTMLITKLELEKAHIEEKQLPLSLREDFKVQMIDAFQPLMYAPPLPPPAPKIILPPPALLPIVAPPPKPAPPPLPFEYLGKIGLNHTVQKEEDIFELVPGQTIAQEYRVERVSEHEAVLIYLPLNESQTLLLKTKDE